MRGASVIQKTLAAMLAAVALLALPALAGCVVEAGVAPPPGVAVGGPPPPPMVEARPPTPGGRVVWVAGYWHWTGMQYTWIPGHWEEERPGAVWRAPRYSLREGVYFYEPGGWWVPPPPR